MLQCRRCLLSGEFEITWLEVVLLLVGLLEEIARLEHPQHFVTRQGQAATAADLDARRRAWIANGREGLSQGQFFRNGGPLMDAVMGAAGRYDRDLTSAYAGPQLTTFLSDLKNLVGGLEGGSDQTTNAEWQGARAGYNLFVANQPWRIGRDCSTPSRRPSAASTTCS